VSRPQRRAPKGRTLDRLDRRAVIANLLARTHRVRLTSAEAALLGDYVREEQRQADENRKAMAGTTQALARHREAADAAIREAEQRAEVIAADRDRLAAELDAAEQRLAAQHNAQEARRRALADALDADEATPWQRLVALARQRTQDAWANGQDCRAEHDRARKAEAALDRVRQADTLGAALAAVAEHDGLTPQAAAVHAALTDRADTTAAQVAEQQREHEIALAAAERRARLAEQALARLAADTRRYRAAWTNARQRARKHVRRADLADAATAQAKQLMQRRTKTLRERAEKAEQALATAREERERAFDLAAARGDALAAHLARTARSSEPALTERCPSCEHAADYHTDPAGCWFTVADGKPNRDAVCGCRRTPAHLARTEATR
jgi:hypothetical protein